MRTKAEIVQELLEKKQITAEDAVVLLMADPIVPIYPAYPWQGPYTPIWQIPGTYCNTAGNSQFAHTTISWNRP